MEKIAIYGKGGSGKSMVASNLSVHFAKMGNRTLQIGCDPKHDSTLALTGGKPISTALTAVERMRTQNISPEEFVYEGIHGIQCIEAGGPEPGVGCAGRGIVMVFQMINNHKYLDKFDVVVLDVLGDVVCGGFAAPLMHGMASRVAILVSDNLMAMYAANNIAKAIKRFRRSGAYLAGLIANNVRNPENIPRLENFAARLNTRLLAVVPHDKKIVEADFKRRAVSDLYPDSDAAGIFKDLSDTIMSYTEDDCPAPTPMEEEEQELFFKDFVV